MVGDCTSSYKIDYVAQASEVLNPKEHPNYIIGSKGTAILQMGWILPINGVALVMVCSCSLRSRLVRNISCVLAFKRGKKKKNKHSY